MLEKAESVRYAVSESIVVAVAVLERVRACSALTIEAKLAHIFVAVFQVRCTLTVKLSIEKIALITIALVVPHHSVTVGQIAFKIANIFIATGVDICAKSTHTIFDITALMAVLIAEKHSAIAVSLSILKLSFKTTAVEQIQDSAAMKLAFFIQLALISIAVGQMISSLTT